MRSKVRQKAEIPYFSMRNFWTHRPTFFFFWSMELDQIPIGTPPQGFFSKKLKVKKIPTPHTPIGIFFEKTQSQIPIGIFSKKFKVFQYRAHTPRDFFKKNSKSSSTGPTPLQGFFRKKLKVFQYRAHTQGKLLKTQSPQYRAPTQGKSLTNSKSPIGNKIPY